MQRCAKKDIEEISIGDALSEMPEVSNLESVMGKGKYLPVWTSGHHQLIRSADRAKYNRRHSQIKGMGVKLTFGLIVLLETRWIEMEVIHSAIAYQKHV